MPRPVAHLPLGEPEDVPAEDLDLVLAVAIVLERLEGPEMDAVAVELEGHHGLGIGPVELSDDSAGVNQVVMRRPWQTSADEDLSQERLKPRVGHDVPEHALLEQPSHRGHA